MAISRMKLSMFLRNKSLRDRYIAAVKRMKTGGSYQVFVNWHADSAVGNIAHDNVSFLHWHRAYIRIFEIELQKADIALQTAVNPAFDSRNAISLPWWDYTTLNGADPRSSSGRTWRDNFMGPSGAGLNRHVPSGPFAGSVQWSIALPPPANVLVRNLARAGLSLPTRAEINRSLKLRVFDNNDMKYDGMPNPSDVNSFRAFLEGFVRVPPGPKSQMHNGGHTWVTGHMGSVPSAPNDPIFWLHHAAIDRLWARWQTRHPKLSDQYPSNAAVASALANNVNALRADQPMRPWTSAAQAWTNGAGTTLFTTDIVRPSDVHNWTTMGASLGSYRIGGVNSRKLRF